MVLEAHVE